MIGMPSVGRLRAAEIDTAKTVCYSHWRRQGLTGASRIFNEGRQSGYGSHALTAQAGKLRMVSTTRAGGAIPAIRAGYRIPLSH